MQEPNQNIIESGFLMKIITSTSFTISTMLDHNSKFRLQRRIVKNCISQNILDDHLQHIQTRQEEIVNLPNVQREIIEPNNLNNPIQQVYRRRMRNGQFRTEVLRARITSDTRNRGGRERLRIIRDNLIENHDLVPSTDEAFHVVGHALGGPMEHYNFVPGSAAVNRNLGNPGSNQTNDFYSVERAMRDFIDGNPGGNRRIEWNVLLTYANDNTGRPSEMLFIAICFADNVRIQAFIGMNFN